MPQAEALFRGDPPTECPLLYHLLLSTRELLEAQPTYCISVLSAAPEAQFKDVFDALPQVSGKSEDVIPRLFCCLEVLCVDAVPKVFQLVGRAPLVPYSLRSWDIEGVNYLASVLERNHVRIQAGAAASALKDSSRRHYVISVDSQLCQHLEVVSSACKQLLSVLRGGVTEESVRAFATLFFSTYTFAYAVGWYEELLVLLLKLTHINKDNQRLWNQHPHQSCST